MDVEQLKEVIPNAMNLEYHTWGNENEWHNLRSYYLGGSDIGVVMGLNKYRSKLSLYKEKAEGISQDLSDNVFIRKGKDLEALIREYYVRPYLQTKGYSLHHFDIMLVDKTYPFLAANLDGLAVCGDTLNPDDSMIVEIKWVSQYAQTNWDGEEYQGVPASYYAQVQQYMLITGCHKALVCALFDDDWSVHYYQIKRDEVFLRKLVKEALTFKNYLDFKVAPPVDTDLDRDALYEQATTIPETKEESPLLAYNVEQYLDVCRQIKELEATKKTFLDDIVAESLDGKILPKDNVHSVRIVPVNTTRFDTATFKKECPDLYKKYCLESNSVRTLIK